MRSIVPFLLCLVLDTIHSDPAPGVIPSKEEQRNLLINVEEVFNQVKLMVSDEGSATDEAVIGDVHKMVERALNYLALLEESALIKLSCKTSDNSVATEQAQSRIQKAIQEGELFLHECIQQTADSIYNNSQAVTTTTGGAMNQGQLLLDSLHRCSKKGGLQQISCYKKVINTDVFPLKITLVEAIDRHKSGHMEAISIRNRANDCVDYVLDTYYTMVTQILSDELSTQEKISKNSA